MKKIVILFLLGSFLNLSIVNANNDSFEKNYLDGGYKEVNKALRESEEYFKRSIALPMETPPIPFTHNFGRLTNSKYKESAHLEINYLNEEHGQNHYIVRLLPIEYKLKFKKEDTIKTIKLNDGQNALLSTKFTGFYSLVFEKEQWQYILSLNTKVSDKVSPEKLVDIANSIQY